jgi:hypothetical protein
MYSIFECLERSRRFPEDWLSPGLQELKSSRSALAPHQSGITGRTVLMPLLAGNLKKQSQMKVFIFHYIFYCERFFNRFVIYSCFIGWFSIYLVIALNKK